MSLLLSGVLYINVVVVCGERDFDIFNFEEIILIAWCSAVWWIQVDCT